MKENNNKKPPLRTMTLGLATLHVISFTLMVLITRNALQLQNVQDELSFYWMYHSHPANQLVHFIFVPTLVWTLCIMFVHAELAPIEIKLPLLPKHNLNHVTLWCILYSWLYLKIDPIGGALYLPIMNIVMYGSALKLKEQDQKESKHSSWAGTGKLFRWSLVLHIASWVCQIWAHAHFEHGKPALLDSFGQALTIAPLFAFYEGLWVVGINTGLREQVLANVALLTKDMCGPESVMHVCNVVASSHSI